MTTRAEMEQEVRDLRAQLPSSMQNCTILFKECEFGHGWLTATNWVQHPCQQCAYLALRSERDALRTMGEKVNAIRNSIIGMQGFNFSEHLYPLVAALNAAGFAGAEYPEARANLGTLIEQRDAAEAQAAVMSDAVCKVCEIVGTRCCTACAEGLADTLVPYHRCAATPGAGQALLDRLRAAEGMADEFLRIHEATGCGHCPDVGDERGHHERCPLVQAWLAARVKP